MALPDLASATDLTNRGIDTTKTTQVTAFLASASAEVRNAAGVPILGTTFTADLPVVESEQWLTLPGQPVTTVANVLIDGEAVTDWKLVGGALWRSCGWLSVPWEPSVVTATITGGLTEVPADIVDLVSSMVGMALAEAEGGGYASRGDITSVRIDDASEQYDSSTGGKTAGVMELPKTTRDRLSARFGGGVAVLRMR